MHVLKFARFSGSIFYSTTSPTHDHRSYARQLPQSNNAVTKIHSAYSGELMKCALSVMTSKGLVSTSQELSRKVRPIHTPHPVANVTAARTILRSDSLKPSWSSCQSKYRRERRYHSKPRLAALAILNMPSGTPTVFPLSIAEIGWTKSVTM